MELRQLDYAVAVAEELHFGRAAERLHVRQQSVSEQIRRLEREIGAPLFTRTSRRVLLTSVGEAFVPEARRAAAAARAALETARQARHGTRGQLRLGYAEDLGPRLFQLAAPEFSVRLPSVRVTPVPASTPEQVDEILGQRLDLGFGWCPSVPAAVDSLLVTREPLVAALSTDDPLAAGVSVDPNNLSARSLAVVARELNPQLHDHVLDQLQSRGAEVAVQNESPTLDRLLPVVLATGCVGVTIASAAAARPYSGIAYRPFSDPSPYVDHRLIWMRGTESRAVTTFVDIVRELRDTGAFLPAEVP